MCVVFVYGSLKRGYRLHHLLAEASFLGEARTQPCYRIVDCGQYPGLLDSTRGNAIHGELFRVSADCLNDLDLAEGVDEGLYERRAIALSAPHESLHAEAWFYLGDTSQMPDLGPRWPRSE